MKLFASFHTAASLALFSFFPLSNVSVVDCHDTNAVLHAFESAGLPTNICQKVAGHGSNVHGNFMFSVFCKEECPRDDIVSSDDVMKFYHNKHFLGKMDNNYKNALECLYEAQRNLNAFGELDSITPAKPFKFNLEKLYEKYPNAYKGIRGMYNLGNTCYFNSATQLLAHVPEIRDFYLSNEYMMGMAEIKNSKVLDADKRIRMAELFANYIRNMYLASDGPNMHKEFSPRSLFDVAMPACFHITKATYNQEDSTEYLVPMIDLLNDSASPKVVDSIFYKTFYGSFGNTLRREHDRHLHQIPDEPFNTLTLEIAGCDNIEGCIRKSYTGFEHLEKNDWFHFPGDSEKLDTSKRVTIATAPKYLFISLKRFSYDTVSKTRKKLSNEITYGLDIKVPVGRDAFTDVTYDLMGVNIHSGSAHGGHYYSYAKVDDDWYVFNDSAKPTKITTAQALGQVQNGYIFLWKKRK